MKTILNKTMRPLAVSLPRGKKLHLGPRKTAQITTEAAEHAALKKLVDAGEVEITDEPSGPTGAGGGGSKGPGVSGFVSGGGRRRSGDR
jgi:hypothetical protein